MKNIKKAIIPAAGLGTRFLPATKSVPKEMLPIVDKPTLLYVVEEAVAAGIEDIVIIAGRGKTAIENFFDTSYEVEDLLEKQGKRELLDQLKRVSSMANIISVRQREAKGLGHAVYCAAPVVGDESFCVLLGDEITLPSSGYNYVTAELIQLFNETHKPCVSVMSVPLNDTSKYGIVDGHLCAEKYKNLELYKVHNVVEKPDPKMAPSRLALPGRYVFTCEIFEHLRNTSPGKNGEIQLTDAMVKLAKQRELLAVEIPNRRYDAGDKLGYLIANIELALDRKDLGEPLMNYLIQLNLRNKS